MRISTLQMFNIANKGMADANEAMAKTQEQLSTGVRVLTPSEDPVASTKIMQLNTELSNITQYQKNIDLAKNNLVAQETALTSINHLIQRMQELAVQAGNTATLSPTEYSALASEVDARTDELLNILNTQNANGDYIFGGYKSSEEPFSGTLSSGFRYQGDEGQQFIKVANNTTVASTDSGKSIFVDLQSAHNTVSTYASSGNTSSPPLQINIGQVVDQEAFDKFYPKDMVVSFNADSAVLPAGKNYTVTERSSGRVIVANQPYVSGSDIELNGVKFKIIGNPVSGEAPTAATRSFGADAALILPADFTPPANETFTMQVAGRSETFVLDGPIANTGDLSAVLNSTLNGNATKLAALGLTATNTGIQMPAGIDFSVAGGSAAVDAVLGLDTTLGSRSSDGVLAKPGDRVFIDSSEKQDILTTLARFSEGMKSYEATEEGRALLKEQIGNTLNNLKNAQTGILNTTSKLGARFNTLDSSEQLHLDSELVMAEVLSKLRDVDYAEAATRLSAESMVLQAAQSAFVRVSQLTLFSRL